MIIGRPSILFVVDRDVESSRISRATPAPGGTRKSRTLFSKLHSKASFLAGLKLGSLLSKKGFELGHGKIASSHTFQLFGKTVNSATSLSYGNGNSLLPILDDSPASEGGTKAGSFDKDVFHVTVIENPWEETVHKVDEIASDPVIEDGVVEGNQTGKTKSQIVKVYQEVKDGDDLLSEHNNLVRDLNRSIHKRTNSKFKATTF
ncbi:hypothetical protein RUM44_011453 [Polyplax serrata]|uniref:Uncharacterized protein n=1 Tax=Polyplax serrata TaxID=468196 RepID=A0ABR1AQ58_POLSC